MGRGAPRILEDFIVPSLDSERFGCKLEWVNRDLGIFRLLWHHKSGPHWNNDCSAVFRAWDIMKHRPITGEKYDTEAKGRFRAALQKIKAIGTIRDYPEGAERGCKQYQIVQEKKKKKKTRVYDQEVYESPSSPDTGSFYGSFTESPSQSPNVLSVNIVMDEDLRDISDTWIESCLKILDNEIGSSRVLAYPQGDIPLSALRMPNNGETLDCSNTTQAAEHKVVLSDMIKQEAPLFAGDLEESFNIDGSP